MRNTRPPRQEPVFHKAGVRPRSPAELLEPSRAPMRPDGNHEPVRPPPAGGLIRFVSGVLTLLLVIMVVVGALSALLYHQFESAGPLPVSRVVAIPKGEGRIEIATRLERQGIISTAGHSLLATSCAMRSVIAPSNLRRANTRLRNMPAWPMC